MRFIPLSRVTSGGQILKSSRINFALGVQMARYRTEPVQSVSQLNKTCVTKNLNLNTHLKYGNIQLRKSVSASQN